MASKLLPIEITIASSIETPDGGDPKERPL